MFRQYPVSADEFYSAISAAEGQPHPPREGATFYHSPSGEYLGEAYHDQRESYYQLVFALAPQAARDAHHVEMADRLGYPSVEAMQAHHDEVRDKAARRRAQHDERK